MDSDPFHNGVYLLFDGFQSIAEWSLIYNNGFQSIPHGSLIYNPGIFHSILQWIAN